jgi:hypothetical protein
MSVQDYRINAEVRRLLVSRWVDVSALRIGATNGVVYVTGRLDLSVEDPGRRQAMDHDDKMARTLRLVMQLERELRRIRDVRDVVFKLENVSKRGGRWRIVEDGRTVTMTATRLPPPVVVRATETKPEDEEDEDGS